MDVVPYTWDKLVTVGGAAAAAMLITQAVKEPLDRIIKIPTRWLVFFLSFVILVIAHVFMGDFAWSNVPLLVLNALLAMFTAMGGYEATFLAADQAKAAQQTGGQGGTKTRTIN